MAFPTPADSSSTTTETTTEDDEQTPFEQLTDEQRETYQDYWGVVETYRGVKKMCLTHLFDNPEGVTNDEILAHTEHSPLAEHFEFYMEQKNDLKDSLRDSRDDGDLPEQMSLPDFKDETDPDFEYEVLSVENAEDWSINPEAFYDDEDAIWVPDEYEPPTDDDGHLTVWHNSPEGGLSVSQVLDIAEDTDGIGQKTLENLKANLEATQ